MMRALLILLASCALDRDVPETPFHLPAHCACYASLVVAADGASMCELPGALCDRVCTCSERPLCYAPPKTAADFSGYICAADHDGDGGV